MSFGHIPDRGDGDAGVATVVEYVMISSILMALLVIMFLLVNANFMIGPANAIAYSAFTDVGNGVSTRIVDTYAIAPVNGNLSSDFDIPDEVLGRNYFVDISTGTGGDITTQSVIVEGNGVISNVAIAGIGSTMRAGGSTTGAGINRISYDSRGF